MVLLYLLLVLILLYVLFPYIWTFLCSVKPEPELFSKKIHYLPISPTIQNYVSLFGLTKFPRYFLNSLIIAFATTVLAVLISILAAYAFSRFRFPMRYLLMIIVLLTTMFPKILLIIPLFMIFRSLHLINTFAGLILAHSTFAIPFSVWMLTGFLETVPRDLELAALIDGCTRVQALLKIVIPLMLPGIAATAVYIFISSWNEYLYALIFTTTPSIRTLPVGLKMFVGKYEVSWGWLTAGGMVTSIPLVILFFLVQKHLIKGLTAGAVKQ